MKTLLLRYWGVALIYILLVSLIAFCMMGVDKRRARRGQWRISESALFLAAILGGSPGAIVGMWTFRHKTRHWYFKLGMPLILVLQVVLACWLLLK